MLLALDTSTRFAGIALYDRHQGLVAEANWHAGVQHTVALLPRVSRMMFEQGVQASDLTAVGVALGPGSFTGLRVGLAAAKGLALAADIPLIGIPTLDVTAYPHRLQPLPVVAIVQAGRGRICWARYVSSESGTSSHKYTLSDTASLARTVEEPVLFAGELLPADRAILKRTQINGSIVAPSALAVRRAGYLGEMAWRRLSEGHHDDVVTLNAIYLQELSGSTPGRSED